MDDYIPRKYPLNMSIWSIVCLWCDKNPVKTNSDNLDLKEREKFNIIASAISQEVIDIRGNNGMTQSTRKVELSEADFFKKRYPNFNGDY